MPIGPYFVKSQPLDDRLQVIGFGDLHQSFLQGKGRLDYDDRIFRTDLPSQLTSDFHQLHDAFRP